MGDPGPSDSSWKKLVIAKTNDQWVSSRKSSDNNASEATATTNISFDYFEDDPVIVKTEQFDDDSASWNNRESYDSPEDPLLAQISNRKSETPEQRAERLAKMSAYAAHRLANESPEKRASRLRRMSEYAAKRLASETSAQRAQRLARMSAYAAKRLAKETPEQRKERLARMSAYAARRHAMKKAGNTSKENTNVTDNNMQ